MDNWLQDLPKLGIVTLVNDRVCLFSQDKDSCHDGVYVAGIEDYDTRRIRYYSVGLCINRHSVFPQMHSILSECGMC